MQFVLMSIPLIVIILIIGILAACKVRFAQAAVRFGVPILLLAQLLILILGLRNAAPTSAAGGKFVILLVGLLSAVGAAVCAFRPNRSSFILCAAAALAGTVSMFIWSSSPGMLSILGHTSPFLLACFGIFMPKPKAEAKVQPEQQPEVREADSAGRMMMLLGEYAGESLPVDGDEELRLGSDPSFCNIVLPADLPPRLCGVRWISSKNTYLITSYSSRQLADGNGRPMPENSSTEFRVGTAFYLVSSGQAVFQVG